MKKEKEIEMNEKYCVACSMIMEMPDIDLVSMCFSCSAFSTKSIDFLRTWVPATCGDDVCYLDEQNQINLDGETCSHLADFESVMDNFYWKRC